jgi:hypothetical protein
VLEFVELESLRRPPTRGHQDLRAWRFRERWRHDATSTVLAWASEHGCVLHDARCAHASKTDAPTAKGRMDDARALFAVERPKGEMRYFGFCGHCLTERIQDFGWVPTERDVQLLENLGQRLRDMHLLQEEPIKQGEMLARMRRYRSGAITPNELRRLLEYYKRTLPEDELDLSALVELR